MAELPTPSADARPTNAGVVTRGLAAVVDAAVVLGLVVAAYAVEAAVIFLIDPRGFVPPDTGVSWFVDLALLLAIIYLTVSWSLLGGTRGDHLLGLRVVNRHGSPPGLLHSALRAVLCVFFPLGLLWVAVSARQRSVQDLLVRTHVVYDWH